MTDFEVNTANRIAWIFTPVTERAKTFVSDNLVVESWQWIGSGFGVSVKAGNELLTRLEGDGFVIEVK